MKQLEKLLKTLRNPALWALCHSILVMKAFILCVKQSSSNVLLVRITNKQKQVSVLLCGLCTSGQALCPAPSFLPGGAPSAEIPPNGAGLQLRGKGCPIITACALLWGLFFLMLTSVQPETSISFSRKLLHSLLFSML